MKKVALLAITSMLLLYAVAGNFYQLDTFRKSAESINQYPDTERSDDAEISPNVFYSVVQTLQPVFHADLALEFEVPFITETKAHSIIETSLNFTQYYRTLFQAIISPNAP